MKKISEYIAKGDNVVILSNHQTEADPQVNYSKFEVFVGGVERCVSAVPLTSKAVRSDTCNALQDKTAFILSKLVQSFAFNETH